jgi:intracellular septation protein A
MSFFKDKATKTRFSHFGAGLVVLIHSYDRYEIGHSYTVFLVAGSLMLLLALFHGIIEKRAVWIDGVFFLIEGSLSFYLAYDYYSLGKRALPLAYVCVALVQLIMARKKALKAVKKHLLKQEVPKAVQ